MTHKSRKEYLQRAEELLSSVEGSYEHSTDIQDTELVMWLIEQAKEVERLRLKARNNDAVQEDDHKIDVIRYGIFLSCVNSNCEVNEYIEINTATTLDTALEQASSMNALIKQPPCKFCSEYMIFKPFSRTINPD